MRMPCISSTLRVTHAGQTSQRVFDTKTHVYDRVTQVKGTYVLKCTLTAGLCGQRGVTAVKGDLHVVHTGHCQDVSSQAGARGMLHFHDWVTQSERAYMSYTQVMARMYQASQVPWPPPRHLSEMAMTSRAPDICTPACRNRARRPNLSAVQNETYVESCNAERQGEL